jgi:hypothetical protein
MGTFVAESRVAYYTIANAAHYAGAVALLASLRSVGEDGPLYIVDCGLTDSQRESLAGQATLVPSDGVTHPGLQKMVGPIAHPAEIMFLLDADVIVNRPLEPLYADVDAGKIVAVTDGNSGRFFPEWSELGLGTPVRRTYVNAGHFALSIDTAQEFVPLFARLQGQLVIPGSTYEPGLLYNPATNPYFYADQDIFNAMLCTAFEGRAVRLEPDAWAVPPFVGLKVTGRHDVLSRYDDGRAPFFLHHLGRKPWSAAVRPSVYSELFTRLVTAPDAPVQLGRDDLPLRLTDSRFAVLDRWRARALHAAHRNLRGRLHIRPAIARMRARRAERVARTA